MQLQKLSQKVLRGQGLEGSKVLRGQDFTFNSLLLELTKHSYCAVSSLNIALLLDLILLPASFSLLYRKIKEKY